MMDSTRHMSSLKTFEWSASEVTLEELVTLYRHLLPFPILVTRGYIGEEDSYYIALKGDVYWAHTAIDNPWIVVQDTEGIRYKIPQCFDATVLPIMPDGTEGIMFPFRDVRERGGYKYIRFVQPSQIVATDVTHNRRHLVMGDLEVVDVYDVTFIAVYELHMENLLDEFHPPQNERRSQGSVVTPSFNLLPSSAPVDVSLAVTLARAPDVIYYHTMAEIKELVDNYQHNYIYQLQQTAVIFVENVRKSDDNYEYIDMTGRSKKQSGNTSQLDQVSKPRQAPVANNIDPMKRLKGLRRFYDTGEMDLTDEENVVHPSKGHAAGDRTKSNAPKYGIRQTGQDPDTKDNLHQGRYEEVAKRLEVPSGGMTATKPQEGRAGCQHSVKQLRSASVDHASYHYNVKPNVLPKPCQRQIPPVNKKPGVVTGTTTSPEQDNELLAVLQRRRFLSEGNLDSTGNTEDNAISVSTGNSACSPNTENTTVHGNTAYSPNTGNTSLSGTTQPTDISSFSVEQIADYLRDLGLSTHVPAFLKGQVDGRLLLSLEPIHLKNDFGLTDFDAVRLIHSARSGSR